MTEDLDQTRGGGPQSDGAAELARAVERLARRLPEPLQPLARLAYNFRWSWTPDGRELFRELGAHRFALVDDNPVRFLRDLAETTALHAATDESYLDRVDRVVRALDEDLARPPVDVFGDGRPVAFLCAEFGVHPALPVYSGGLGVLAGDVLKEASDRAYPFVGVGLLYRRGYFHQRVDLTGWQHEYWLESDPETMPVVRVRRPDGSPLTVSVPIWDEDVAVHVWRAQVGRVPLYLLDTEVTENTPLERWVSTRLYEGSRSIRLAQYAVLGLGGVRALDAMGIDPALFHLNEGHPALAALEIAAREAPAGTRLQDAIALVRDRFAFTTHTPVPAGNETYAREELLAALGRVPTSLGFDQESFLELGRVHQADAHEPAGLTPLAIRAARSTNGVSRRHGGLARAMWHPIFPDRPTDAVPIGHVTNGVHLPTWMAPPMQALLDRYFPADWRQRQSDPAVWEAVDAIPDEELWEVRNVLRMRLIDMLRRRVVTDRLARGEAIDFARQAESLFEPGTLTIGFARRLATYKRLNLVAYDPGRAVSLLQGDPPVQLVFAGKAHPLDDGAKAIAQRMFALKRDAASTGRVAFVEDYDMRIAPYLVSGCDVWLNLPRPPLEASGTSGMKAAMNGGLMFSVLDGWWPEAADGTNGWSIDGSVDADEAAQDARDAQALYDTIEHQIRPLFHERGEDGIPRAWIARVRESLRTIAPRFTTTRMVGEYVETVYRRSGG